MNIEALKELSSVDLKYQIEKTKDFSEEELNSLYEETEKRLDYLRNRPNICGRSKIIAHRNKAVLWSMRGSIRYRLKQLQTKQI